MRPLAHRLVVAVSALAATFCVVASVARADEDPRVARERAILHRAQEALRQSEAENSALTQGRMDAEQKLKDARSQAEAAQRAAKTAQSSLQSQQQAAAAAQAELSRKLEEADRQLAALNARQRDTAGQLVQRESELKQTQSDLQKSKDSRASCEAKNLTLYEYSRALVDQYHKKGVWAALSQKEPVFGFKEVSIENTLQEYQQKLDAQKIAPVKIP